MSIFFVKKQITKFFSIDFFSKPFIIKLSKKFKGYSALVDGLEEKLKSFCNHIDSLEYQYEKDLKQISDTLLDDLLKEDYLSVLHTHFDIGEH